MNSKSPYRQIRRRQEGQAGLIGLLAVMVIILILAGLMYPKLAGRNEYDSNGGVKGTATPMDRAYDTGCTIYMQQVTAAAVQYRQDHNRPAPDLESLKPYGVTEEIINTPNCNFGLPKNAAAAPSATPGQQLAAPGQNTPVVVGGGIRVPVNTGAKAAGVDTSSGDDGQ